MILVEDILDIINEVPKYWGIMITQESITLLPRRNPNEQIKIDNNCGFSKAAQSDGVILTKTQVGDSYTFRT